jgi:hypothetical protein
MKQPMEGQQKKTGITGKTNPQQQADSVLILRFIQIEVLPPDPGVKP